MCRLGAEVTGIDASDKNINIAKIHSKKNNLKIDYFCSSPENFKIKDKFDPVGNQRKKTQDKKATEYEKKTGTSKEDGYFR